MSHRRKSKGVTVGDLNERSATRLLALVPGVGTAYAPRIVEHRAVHGPFQSASDLAKVRGIGPRRAERLWNGLRPTTPGIEDAPRVLPSEPEPPPAAVPRPPCVARPLPAEPPVAPSEAPDLREDVAAEHVDGWFRETGGYSARCDTLSMEPRPAHEGSSRASVVRFIATAAMSLVIGIIVTAVATRISVRAAPTARNDDVAMRSELEVLRAHQRTLRAEQEGAGEDGRAAMERIDALEARLDAHARELDEVSARGIETEESARKRADYLETRVGRAEDEMTWQRLVSGARDAIWKAKARRAAGADEPSADAKGQAPPAAEE